MKKFLLLLLFLVSTLAVSVACGGDNSKSDGDEQSSQTVEVALKDMEISLSSKSFSYDGTEHALEIEGDLPQKAVVVWQNNSLTEVGEKLVFATVRCAGYKEVNLKATLTVVGQDMASEIALENETLSVGYGEAYSFQLKDETLLPDGAALTETYINMNSGEALNGKPDFGGEFRYVLQIVAPGYNVKTVYGQLTIARPEAVSVEIINLPTVAIAKYRGQSALLPNVKWTPQVEILPKGHKDVELTFATDNDGRIAFENGTFIASENYGNCEITVSIKGTEISKTYTVVVPECSFYYEDFEDASKSLYVEQYVMEKNENGQMDYTRDENGNYVFIPIPRGKEIHLDANGKAERDGEGNVLFFDKAVEESYYGACASSGTSSAIISQNGSNALQVTGVEQFSQYYSFLEIDGQPNGGWQAGRYRVEMNVTGYYPFTFYWVNPNVAGGVELIVTNTTGVSSSMQANIVDGKIVIEFNLTEGNLADGNALRFAAFTKEAFQFTIDDIMILKVK